tara:strand:- start:819 stop:1151 length:333 start_codon:yes stop_codon:yes gene_type:complete
MKRLPRNIFYLILILLSFSACQSVKESFSGSKKSNSDEFLVEKKNPLVLPTDFDKLPEPKTLIVSDENKEEEIDLKTILTKENISQSTESTSKNSSSSVEQSVLEKIKSN